MIYLETPKNAELSFAKRKQPTVRLVRGRRSLDSVIINKGLDAEDLTIC